MPSIVEEGLVAGYNIECKSFSKKCNKNCIQGALILISKGARIDAVDNRGFTPLCLAARAGNVEMVKLLVRYGASVHHRTNQGLTPLYLAASRLHKETVFYLRECNADITFTDIIQAMKNKNVVELLKDAGANLSVRDISGRSLLHWAAWEGYDDTVAWLINAGLDVDAADGDDWTPLHYAARDGHVEVAKILLEGGASIDTRDKWGDTPLNIASFWEHTAFCEFLTPMLRGPN